MHRRILRLEYEGFVNGAARSCVHARSGVHEKNLHSLLRRLVTFPTAMCKEPVLRCDSQCSDLASDSRAINNVCPSDSRSTQTGRPCHITTTSSRHLESEAQ